MLDLFDICADEAARRGDLDGVRRMVERAIELEPYDDLRYLRIASALLEDGRRGEALSVVNRARSALAEVGLELPRSLLDLERSIISLRHRLRTLRGAALVQPARSVVGPALTGEPHATVELLR